MQRRITINDISNILWEARSHSGLPVYKNLATSIKQVFIDLEVEEGLFDHFKNRIVNEYMQEVHNNRILSINPNIKSYDW